MIDVVLFGIQGSWKWTQATLLSEKFQGKFSYFSSWDIFRALIKTPNPIWEYVSDRIKKWDLIDDRITESLFRAYAYTVIDDHKAMLLDWYPRSMSQLEDLFKIAKENKRKVIWIWYDVPDAIVKERMSLRWRDDDTDESITHRIKQFYDQTMPVINYFKENAELVVVSADDTIENIHSNTVNALNGYM